MKPKRDPAPPATPSEMLVEQWPIARPQPYAKNARTMSDRAIEVVAASIKEFGFRQPIVVDAHDVIIVGHKRLLGAQLLEMATVPVHVARDLTPAQVKAYRLADNRTADESDWDLDLLAAEMAEIEAMGIDLTVTGFDEAEVEELLKPPPLKEDDDVPPPPATPTSAAGDVWLCGPHRVMCGDALDLDAVQRLLATKPVDLVITTPATEPTEDEETTDPALVFTDPPYNVDYEGYKRPAMAGSSEPKGRAPLKKIAGDGLTRSEFLEFLAGTFASYRAAVKPGASLYICHPSSMQREFQDALEAAGFEVRTQIIWAKNTFAWGFGRYKFQHEPIFYAHVKHHKDAWHGDKSQSTLWQANKPSASRLHPTMKPVELIEHALENSSRPRQIVLDLFGGSGSTLIACEKTGRRGRLMELDPVYTDVIVDRWQQYTGNVAILEGARKLDGGAVTFADMRMQRGEA